MPHLAPSGGPTVLFLRATTTILRQTSVRDTLKLWVSFVPSAQLFLTTVFAARPSPHSVKRGYRMIYMGPKGSFEPGCSDSKLKVEPIKPTNNRGADGSPQELTPLGLVGVSLWRPWWVGTPLLEPAHDRTVGRVHCPPWLS